MTDHRTTAENDLARAVHALADAIATHARDCPTPDCLLAAGHTGDHDTTDLPSWSCGKCDRIEAFGHDDGEVPEHHRDCPNAIDHAVLQQHADRARAAFPGTDQRLCMAEGRTPRGNRVVCSQPRDNHTRHSAGGYWWDDDGSSGSTLTPGTVPPLTVKRGRLRYRGQTIETRGSTLHAAPFVALHTSEGGDTSALATDVPDGSHEHGSAPTPASCGHTWKGRNTLVDCRGAHTCAQPDTHPNGRHVCSSCGQTTPAVDVCGYPGANGTCQREAGHRDVHYDEHGGVFATGSDVVDNRSQLDRLADWIIANVDGEPSQSEGAGDTAIRIIDGLQATVSGQRVLIDSYERQIRALTQQNGQLRDQRDRESELRLAAQQAAVDPDLHQKLRRIDNVLRGAQNAERTPSTLPFIDLVTDLGYQADAVVDDLTSERESRATVFETAKTLSQAIVHTVEYVGNDTLPAAEGWSWYDALRHFHPDAANRFLTNPVRPKAQQ
ncbi:hypothetical protein SEA_BIBWIT_58 [Gordonia phage Bibwit]|uniref:Uncharacterized protein n=1 Tax=Gordonia phage Bibwit TaxID=2483666 RepID=A0A3G3M840_9CAUD|nr:hypothetical protein KNU18_gp58 [Gordonia phage Bibwit]AYR02611.1 hypothetical protein SEA_BIBWIT_58 [Gordonia phage Bibwit]